MIARAPELSDEEARVLETISSGMLRGGDLARATGIWEHAVLLRAVRRLLDLDLIECSSRQFSDSQFRSVVFSTLPSRKGIVSQVLMNKRLAS